MANLLDILKAPYRAGQKARQRVEDPHAKLNPLEMVLSIMSGPPKEEVLASPIPEPTATPTPTKVPTPTPTPSDRFGKGKETAFIEPDLFDALMQIVQSEKERILLAELSGQESSYGYAGPHITEKEASYGPYHINLMAGRINPLTGHPFRRKEAEDPYIATQYALEELRRTGGLGAWNPGVYPFYQFELPRRAKTKTYKRADEKGK
jgi:hypothetical protein